MKKKFKKGQIWILIGILCLMAALGFTLKNVYDDYAAGQATSAAYEEVRSQINAAIAARVAAAEEEAEVTEDAAAAEETVDTKAAASMPTVTINGYSYIGTLYIPYLDRELTVMDAWSDARLKKSPCRYTGSVYTNDLVICGHNYNSHFAPLKWMEIGEEVIFTDMDGIVYHYVLAYTEVVDPDDVETMCVGNGDWDLTIFTCTTGGNARMTLRFTLDYIE